MPNWANSSARIAEIEDVRATGYYQNGNYSQIYYHTYVFSYNNDSPRHLTSITNTINTGENYSFSYAGGQGLYSPFNSQYYGGVAELSNATVSNIGTSHQFIYDTSGELTKITLPYHGYLAYSYVTGSYTANNTSYRSVGTRYLSADGTLASQLPYSFVGGAATAGSAPVPLRTVVQDPSGSGDKAWVFGQSGATLGLTTIYYQRQYPCCTTRNENDFTWAQDSAGNSYIASTLTTADPGQSYQAQKKINQTVDIHGNVTQVAYYAWGNLSTPSRTDNFTYLSSSAYTSRYIFNRMTSSPTTTIQYDGWPPGPVSGLREWDGSAPAARGNPTGMTGPSGTTSVSYNAAGAPVSTTTNGVTTNISTTSATNYAAPSQMSVGSLSETMSYSAFLELTNETGPNGASVSLGYDANARPTSATSPFGATTTTTYADTATPPTITTSVNGRWTRQTLDGLGRTIKTETGYGGTTVSQAETVYGPCGCSPLGKMIKQAVPHAPGATPAYTVYNYDALGRTVSVVAPDGASTTYYSYQGNWVGTSDPAGHWKSYQLDTFGNITAVQEPIGGGYYYTYYTYDNLGHLTAVSMPRPTGTQTRSFTYSGNLLLSATNPENGTVSYTYNGYNKVATRTDATGQKVAYSYDNYARLTQVRRYPNGSTEDTCQQENYYYDSNPFDGSYSQNALGRLAAVQYMGGYLPYVQGGGTCDTTFTEMYSYSSAGGVVAKRLRVTRTLASSGNPYYPNPVPMNIDLNGTFGYDNEGRMTGEQFPVGGPNLSFGYDSMGRPYSLSDGGGAAIGSATYGPANELVSMGGGSWGTETRTYNALKQLTGISSPGWNLQYNYSAAQNNGKIVSQSDLVSGEQVSYAYDSLSRLASASSNQSWSQSFVYDGFGNLTNVNGVNAPGLGVVYDAATNHATGGCSDANGNMICGGYRYDVENRLATVPGVFYSYAPGNKRVWRGSWNSDGTRGTDEVTFWAPNGQRLGTYAVVTIPPCYNCNVPTQFYATQTGTEYYFRGRLIKNASGWVYADRLGSTVKTYPYGVERPSATGNGKEKFTGYFRDAETGLDYAVNRYEQSGVGRFLTPDPYVAKGGGSGNPADPSSWNKYSYVDGDPINYFDPTGLFLVAAEDDPPRDFCDLNPFSTFCFGQGGGGGAKKPTPLPPVLTGPITPTVGQQKKFANAWKDAYDKLTKKKDCAKDFGPDASVALETADFEFGAVFAPGTAQADPSVYAATNLNTRVITINAVGHFFTLHSQGQDWTMNTGLGDTDFDAFILLHELGHLTGVLGDDRGNQSEPSNPAYQFNKQILNDCFGVKNWSPTPSP